MYVMESLGGGGGGGGGREARLSGDESFCINYIFAYTSPDHLISCIAMFQI